MENEIAGEAGKWDVLEGVNENGEHLVDVCAERRLFLANILYQHSLIRRHTWEEGRRGMNRRAHVIRG